MRKIAVFSFILISNFLFSQEDLNIKFEFQGDFFLKENYSNTNEGSSIKKINLVIERTGKEIPDFDIPIKIVDTKLTASTDDYKILNTEMTLSADDFNKKGAKITHDIYIEVMNDDLEADKGDEVFSLAILVDLQKIDKKYHDKIIVGKNATITIINAPKELSSYDPFRITVGANFDFEKTVKASLYFDAQAYRPNLWNFNKKDISSPMNYKRKLGIGFYGSLYSNKYISQDSIQRLEQFTDVIGTTDTVTLIQYSYQLGFSNSIKNVGAEIGLVFGTETKIDADTYFSHSFLFPELSAIHRRITTTYSYNRINADTLYQVARPDSIRRLIERDFTTSKYDEVLIGLGYIGRYHSQQNGEFMFKWSTGPSFDKSGRNLNISWYYSFRFQLIDPKVGINLGGEVRGYYDRGNPYFAVYLSKSFGLKKLTEF